MIITPNRIKERRAELGLTQAELAEKLKISVGYLSSIENEKRNISLKLAFRIASVLNANINEIFFGE